MGRNGLGFLVALESVLKMLERVTLDYRTSQRPLLRDLIEEVKLLYPLEQRGVLQGSPDQSHRPAFSKRPFAAASRKRRGYTRPCWRR